MFESKKARQQYLPADVIVAAGESTVLAAWLTGTGTFGAAVTSVPTLPPRAVTRSRVDIGGPQSQNLTVPLHVVMPVTVTTASSLTVIDPAVVIDSPPAGMLAPAPSFGVVRRLEPQSWKLFSAKSSATFASTGAVAVGSMIPVLVEEASGSQRPVFVSMKPGPAPAS